MASLLGLGLMLALSLPGARATDCESLGPATRLTFTRAARDRWLAPRVRAPGPLDHLYGTVRRFLSTVQLNPFPAELVRNLLNEPASVKVDEVVRYEAGYVVCAVIAGLYLLVVPTAGLCFCCCRGHQRCGGPVKTEYKEMACERGTLMTFLLLTTLVLLIGVVCAFVTNQCVHEQMGPSVEAVPEMLLSLRGLVSDVPQELQAVAQQFSVPQNRVLKDLDGVAGSIGTAIHTQLQSSVYEVLASLLSLGQALQVSVDHLRALNATLLELREGQQDLDQAISAHRQRLRDLLQQPSCQGCQETLSQAHGLELGADFSQMPHVDDVLHRLEGVPEANFSSMVREGNNTFNALPPMASLQLADVVKELKKAVAQQPKGLKTLAKAFPNWEAASRWSQALEKVENSSRPYLKEVQRYEKYRWIVGYVLCSVVLLVVVCNLVGLNLGIWGLSAQRDRSHLEAKGRAGARILMVGANLSFLFAAPLILLVFSTFLVGGNVQTLVCRSWESGKLYEFVDTPGNLPSSMNLSHLLGLKKNISILLAYQQCRKGAPLWRVLQLNDSYDLEPYLDLSQYSTKLEQELQNLKVDMENLDLLSPAGLRDLQALQSSGLSNIDYPGFLIQTEKPVVNTSVEKLAHDLEGLARTQGNSGLGKQLQEEAQGLRTLYQEKVLPQQSLVAKLNISVRALAFSAPNLQQETSGVLDRITRLQGELPAWAARILRNVTQHIATCQPLSGALDNGRVILCDMMADPWNAFWFCLAWCTFFLVPSIIFAIKTSKYFHPIWKRLSSSSSEETQLFHIPRVTSLKL
ncbi:PREDICTED: prominin-2 isoform X2 [Myotis davidii]|uniref:prominin-2 isoform X2 n=1 Tax=Myotis davidii TaxID=225400 RepID=UPI000767C951|nr:PREDICTED: prominin-2 isoform X2 [Myotis davidii]